MKTKLLKKIVTVGKYAFFGMIIQCLFFSSLLAGETSGQTSLEEVYVSLNEDEMSVEEIFKAIEKETDFRFSYKRGDVRRQSFTNEASSADVSIGNVLRQLSMDADLKFKRINNVIYVGKKGHEIGRAHV